MLSRWRVGDKFEVSGRVYKSHDGTLYPVSGVGCHQLTSNAFKALGVLNKFGDTAQAHGILGRMKTMQPTDVEAALRAWRAGQ